MSQRVAQQPGPSPSSTCGDSATSPSWTGLLRLGPDTPEPSPVFLQDGGGFGGTPEDARGIRDTPKCRGGQAFRRKATCHRGLAEPHSTDSSPVLLASPSAQASSGFTSPGLGAFSFSAPGWTKVGPSAPACSPEASAGSSSSTASPPIFSGKEGGFRDQHGAMMASLILAVTPKSPRKMALNRPSQGLSQPPR